MGKDVLLYFPHGGTVRAEFMVSVLRMLGDPASPVGQVREMHSGPVIGMARTTMAADFLASPYEWLWMVDADIVFSPRTPGLLLAAADPAARPVMGALCWTVIDTGKIPTMYRLEREDGTGRTGFTSYSAVPAGQVVRVDATGAACLLLHRSVFKRLDDAGPPGTWFAERVIDGRQFGEDLSFCLRCADAGIPVHVNTAALTGHAKTVILGDLDLDPA